MKVLVHLKMKVISTILIVCFCFKHSVQDNDVIIKSSNDSFQAQSNTNETEISPSYTWDPQVAGFESSNLTSGPIVLADKRTLFIPDLRLEDVQGEIEFWTGTGITPYNDPSKEMVFKDSLDSPINLYVTLPEHLTLDNVTYFQAMTSNGSLDYVIFQKVDRRAIRNYSESNKEDTLFRVPKCCLHSQYLNNTLRDCGEARRQVNLNVNIFESNETGLDPDVKLNYTEYRLIPYHQDLRCNENSFKVKVDDLNGLIYNSSLIIQGMGILSHRDYCVDVLAMEDGTSETVTLSCLEPNLSTSDPDFYLPVLAISAICFAMSAAAYGVILRVKDIHKRCFIIFSSTMCVAFMSLVIMQVQSNSVACNLFGFLFLFTFILSFFWLLILCLELLYLVRFPIEESRYDERWYWYGGVSLGISFLLFLISLFSGQLWTPDVPNSFIMNYSSNRCEFETTFARTFIIFAPLIVTILGSVASLIALTTFINKNEENINIKNHVDWLMHRNSYKFLYRSYFIIIIVATFWIFNLFNYTHRLESGKTQLALDIIKASLGIVTFFAFVVNKYTREEIKQKFAKKRKSAITEVGLGLNGIPTPETPMEIDPLVRHQQNMTSFQNNRVINNG